MSELDFIYNDNYDHRGVWHVTDNLTVEVFPAKVVENQYGDTTYRYLYDEYEQAKGKFLCGQGSAITGSTGWGDYRTPVVDGVKTLRRKARRALYQRGLDNPPAPLCSRCAKKARLDA
jgi:hypothetical protein